MPTISAIKPQQKNPRRVNVFLDGAYAFACAARVAERCGLQVGQTLTAADISAIEHKENEQHCFDKAASYLTRRMHSRNELRVKLLKAGFVPAIIETALNRLMELGYVNDAEFARQKLAQAQHKLIGQRKALTDLMKSGVKGEVARSIMREHFDTADAADNAQKLIETNVSRMSRLETQVAKRRLIGLLLRRGFDYQTIKPLVDRALGRESESDD